MTILAIILGILLVWFLTSGIFCAGITEWLKYIGEKAEKSIDDPDDTKLLILSIESFGAFLLMAPMILVEFLGGDQ